MPVDRGGCGQYRIRQPLELLKAHTEHDTHVVDTVKDDMVAVAEALAVADVAIVRQGGEIGMQMIKEKPEYAHLKWVLDIDDNVELISPYSEHYKEYGTKEYFDRNSGNWIWRNGVHGFDVSKNMNRILNLLNGMKEADMVTVTTQKLANYAKKYNPNVVVLPNAVDVDKWWKLDFKPNKQLRVGWSGGISHYEDWYSIQKPLNDLMRKYQFKLVNVGSSFQGIVDEDNKGLLEIHPWVAFEAHSWHMACMNLDVAIVPLADLPFNNYKSSIKFYEMSALGVPSVVSNILPYKKDVKDGENALGYDSAEDFYNALESLLKSSAKRKKIGDGALKWVNNKHNAKKLVPVWENAYASLLK